jgi:hypothetical protein
VETDVVPLSASEFADLVEELVDLETERTDGGGGLSGTSAARRTRIERRLMHLLCVEIEADERRSSIRVPTNLTVMVRIGINPEGFTAKLTNVGVGGAYIDVPLLARVGDDVQVTVERRRGSLEHGFQLRGRVAWLAIHDGRSRGFGINFQTATEADERRLRRLVLDLLREYSPRPA